MNKKRTTLVVSAFVVVCLAIALVAGISVYGGNMSESAARNNDGVTNLAVTSAPAEDGTVSHQYTDADKPSDYTSIGGSSGRDISYIRSNPSGKYMLMSNITVNSVDTATNFTGILDGNGYTITLSIENRDTNSDLVGGLFKTVSGGTIKNLKVVASKFIVGTNHDNTSCGIVAGSSTGNAVFSNIRVTLAWSPTNEGNGTSDFYYFQNTSRSKDAYIRLGGLLGITQGDTTIEDTTVENVTTGNYGFSINGWRDGGDFVIHSDGFHDLGGFVASAEGGTVNLNRITFAGNASSRITIRNESTSKYRYNATKSGLVVGYMNNGTYNVNGLIISYPAVIDTNIIRTNMNYEDQTSVGIVVGWDDDKDGTINVSKMYFVNGASTSWISGKKNNISGVTTFDASMDPIFVDENNIAFYGAVSAAPDSADLTYQIKHGSQTQVVADQLILKDGETADTVWVTVPTVENVSGTDYSVNLNYSKVSQGTYAIETAMTPTSSDGEYNYFKKLYDGNLITAPVIRLQDSVNNLTISNVYTEAAPDRNAGEHILNYNSSAIIDADYNVYTYGGKCIVGNPIHGVMYLPTSVTLDSGSAYLDIAKDIKVTVNKLPIQIGYNSTSFITYGDTLEAVKAKNTDVVIKSVNGVAGAAAPDAIEDWDVAGYVPYAQNAGAPVPLSVQNVTMTNGSTDNYIITTLFTDTIVAARQIKGSISLADGVSLVYDGTAKTAKFDITSGNETDPEIGSRIIFEYTGDNTNVGTFTAKAVLPAVDGVANYIFSSDSVISAQYTITPMAVSISAKAEQSKAYDNTQFTDYASLFNMPQGALDDDIAYDFSVSPEGIINAGVYTVTATLSGSETNYTSNSATVNFTVNKAQISGTIQMPADMSYDGTAKIPTYVFAEGSQLYADGEKITFEYSGSNVNAGEITVTAKLPSENYEFLVDGSASATQTAAMQISKRQVNLSVDNIVKEYDGEIYDFSGVSVSGTEDFVDEFTLSVSSPSATANAGSYPLVITTSLDDNSNYTVVKDADKTLTINPKSVNLTIDNATKVYDGKLYDFNGYTVNGMDGFIASDAVTASVSATNEKADKGVYALVISTSADANPNYTITKSEDKTLTVTARSVTLTVENATKTYDAKPYDFTDYEVTIGGDGFVAEDAVGVTVFAQGATENKGVYPIKITTTADDNANYDITRSDGATLTIEALQVHITAKEPQSKTFDGQAFTDYASLFNIPSSVTAEGQGAPLVYDYAITKDGEPVQEIVNAGTYTVTATLAAGQDNYVSDSASVEFTVNALEVTIEATQSSATSMYDGDVVTGSEITKYFVIPNDVEGNPLSVTISISGKDTQILNAGTYTVTMSLNDASGNYTATPATLTYELIKQQVAVPVPETQVFTYNGSQFTYVIATNPRYTVSGNKGTTAGSYTATVTLNDTENYQWNTGKSEPLNFPWTINKAESHVTPVVEGGGGSGNYFDGHAMPAISTSEGDTPGTIAWVESILVYGTTTYNWTFTPEDTANYTARKGTVTINVKQIKVASVTAEYTAGEDPVYTSTPLDSLKQFLTVKAVNNDGSIASVLTQEQYTLSGTLTAGTSSITVSYNGFTATVNIDNVIGVVLERIEITSLPHKTAYTVFETLNTEGMVITAYYTDGASKVVTESCSASVSELAIDTTNVTFTYTDSTGSKSVDLAVTVSKIKVAAPDVDEGQHFIYNSQTQTFAILDGEHYSVSGNTGTEAKSYTAVISLDDSVNYEWTTGNSDDIYYEWTIEKMTIKGEIVMPGNLVFDGEEKSAEFNVTVGQLFLDDSIVLEYEGDRVNAGSVNITAKLPSENYVFAEDSVTTAQMIIKPYSLEISFSELTVVYGTPTEDFDISTIVATVRGTSGTQVEIGSTTYNYTITVDYADPGNTYEYGDPKDTTYPLSVTVVIDGLDEGNYTYVNTATLKVIATPLEGVLVADSTNVEYDGLAHGARLTETTASESDYEIQYSLKGKNEWSATAPVNAGTYTVRVVSLTDSYSGDRISSIEIVILQKTVTITANQSEVTKTYKGEVTADELAKYFTAPAGVLSEGALALAVTVTGAGEKVSNVGVYTLTAKLHSSVTNYKANSVSIKYTVTPATAEVPTPAVQNFTYNTQEQTYVVGDSALYAVSGNKATDAGSYIATVKLVDKRNYVWADTQTTADKTFSWSIAKALPTVNPKVEGEVFYDGYEMPQINISAGDTLGTIVWTDSVLQLGKSEYAWKFIPTDTKNYETLTGNYSLSVTAIALKSITAEVKDGVTIYTSFSLDDIKNRLDISGINNDGSLVEAISPELVRIEGEISAGAKIFNIYYLADEGITDDFAVNIVLVELASIKAVFVQDGLTVYPNTPLDSIKSNLTVTGYNNDGSEYGVIEEYELSGDFSKASSVITVHYTGSDTSLTVEDTTFVVTVSTAKLDRIEITAQPSKTQYIAFEPFNRNGMEVTAYYTDGTNKTVSDFVVTVQKMEVKHTQEGIEITYTEDEITKSAVITGLTVEKRSITPNEPLRQTFIYNGNEQTFVYDAGVDGEYYGIIDNVKTDAGNYTAYIVLRDKENCVWSIDGSVTDIPVEWSIAKRNVTIVRSLDVVTGKTYDGKAVDLEYFRQFFSINTVIGEEENFTIEDIGIELTFASGESQIVNAGKYTVMAKLSVDSAKNFSSNTVSTTYEISKASRLMEADMSVGYKTVTFELKNGLEDAYYSFDNKSWQKLESLTLNVGMSDKYDIYLKYNEGNNYLASKTVLVEKKITKAALYEYIKETFDETFTKEDIAAFEVFKTYAKDPDGESKEYDEAYANLLAQYEQVSGELIGAISSALSTGSKMAGYHSTAIAVSWTMSSLSTGFALIALSLSAGKKGEKKSRLRRMAVAGLLLTAVVFGAVFAVAGCEKVEVDNMADVLEIVKSYNNLKVDVIEGEESIYTYDKDAITVNKYNLLLNVNSLIGEKTDANISLTKDNFVGGYTIVVDESKGTATVKGKLKNTGIATLDNANVEIVCNLKTETASKYQVSYTDAWGYKVVIDLV